MTRAAPCTKKTSFNSSLPLIVVQIGVWKLEQVAAAVPVLARDDWRVDVADRLGEDDPGCQSYQKHDLSFSKPGFENEIMLISSYRKRKKNLKNGKGRKNERAKQSNQK